MNVNSIADLRNRLLNLPSCEGGGVILSASEVGEVFAYLRSTVDVPDLREKPNLPFIIELVSDDGLVRNTLAVVADFHLAQAAFEAAPMAFESALKEPWRLVLRHGDHELASSEWKLNRLIDASETKRPSA